jgi:hypothetical protein
LSAIEQNFLDISFIIVASIFVDEWVFGSFIPFRLIRATLVKADERAYSRVRHSNAGVRGEVPAEIFYPAVRAAIDDDDLMNEAMVEHGSAKDLIAQIQSMRASDPMYDAVVTVLSEYINHHVEEEQNEMFPKAQKSDMDLEELGVEIAERKKALM